MIGNIKPYEQEGVPASASPWLLAARQSLTKDRPAPELVCEAGGFRFEIYPVHDSVWVTAHWPKGGGAAFRTAYAPLGDFKLLETVSKNGSCHLALECATGQYHVDIEFPSGEDAILRWTTSLTPVEPLKVPFWPRDLYVLGQDWDPLKARGVVHAMQRGIKNPLIFLTLQDPAGGSLLYFQNLTSLNPYFQETGTSPKGCIAGEWPELGFSLTPNTDHALGAKKKWIVSDAFVTLSDEIPEDERQASRLFLDLLAKVYLRLPRPKTDYHDWIPKAEESLKVLNNSRKVTVHIDEQQYIVPYVAATDKPPEAMVQLAVLMPLLEYEKWRGKDIPLIKRLRPAIEKFYDPNLHSLVRWLPGQPFPEGPKEEQEVGKRMDSWYLQHPLLNLARMAQRGDEGARKLFFNSLDFAIRVAQVFKYEWPIFYEMKNVELVKQESAPGEGGETDVACIYILVMMQAYELSKDERYIQEAENAAQKIVGLGFNLTYQLNVTMFGTGALWRLYRATGKEIYRDLSYVCVANMFHNAWLWECDYGYAKNYPTFMGVLPLKDNFYLASFEELEVLAAIHDYLTVGGEEIPASIRLLLCEFARYVLDRGWYYYPDQLPKEAISEKVKTGEIDPELAIPLEDLYDGWQKAGQVGQEVYGTGGIFTFITRHYLKPEGVPEIVYLEYPVETLKKGEPVSDQGVCLKMRGDPRLEFRMRLIPQGSRKKSTTKVFERVEDQERELEGTPLPGGQQEFWLRGGMEYWLRGQPDGAAKNGTSNGAARRKNSRTPARSKAKQTARQAE